MRGQRRNKENAEEIKRKTRTYKDKKKKKKTSDEENRKARMQVASIHVGK